ncbi:ABC transporter permease [Schleiferilactobacillus perolens]|uniref:Putative hemin transport system permease protein HrtB n=1 Tax=Schleiferilactobacillus perolens DSM 12744 TaxID=1423792 RepID=A0A0R1NA38_9LACO|nr:ABC transporter permease [Schleiferilactobacillus perolens]KRL14757.1 hypothetical protein FD09_GL000416 [Schleiferilactobacillus perolens DSM 12744]
MGIINRLTLRTLQGEKGRTILTILSMGVAATLAVASLVGFTSAQSSLYHKSIQDTGGMQVAISNIPRKNVASLVKNGGFEKVVTGSNLGTVKPLSGITDWESDQLPTLTGMDPVALKTLVTPILTTGRLPRTTSELLVPSNVGIKYKAGGVVRLQTINGPKNFTVVGSVTGFHDFANAYTWITYQKNLANRPALVAGSLKNLNRVQANMTALAKRYGVPDPLLNVRFADRALALLGAGSNLRDKATIVTLLAIMLAIIGIAAGMMIYTSINLSVRSRIQRYGLLRSIGATPKQIRKLVYREGVTLILPALVLGYAAGIGGISVTMATLNQYFTKMEIDIHLYLAISPWPLVGSALFMILITFLASARPAARAAGVSPLAAVRDNLTTPKLRRRQLKPGIWGRLAPTPLSRLAVKNYRRSGGVRWTMIATLSISIMIFVGFTEFARTVLRDVSNDFDPVADISGDGYATQSIAKPLAQLKTTPGVADAFAAKTAGLELSKRPTGFRMSDMTAWIVPDQVLKNQFDKKTTLISTTTRVYVNGQRRIDRNLPASFQGDLQFKKYGTIHVDQTITPNNILYRTVGDGLVISESQYARITKDVKLESKGNPVRYAVTLTNKKDHAAVFKAVQQIFPGNGWDSIAGDQTNKGILTAAQLLVYGFLALLSLVSLANIINHIFANLLQRRRQLAMLQSIGTTPPQIAGMLAIENGLLLVASLFWGSVLGTLLTMVLLNQLSGVYQVGFRLPWLEIGIVAAVLLVVWLIFNFVSYRLVRRQDIDHWLRLN